MSSTYQELDITSAEEDISPLEMKYKVRDFLISRGDRESLEHWAKIALMDVLNDMPEDKLKELFNMVDQVI